MRQAGTAFVVLALITVSGLPANAQTSAPVLNYLPSGTDVAGRAPELFTTLRDGLFAVVDPLDGRVVLLGRDGRVQASSAELPFVPVSVRETAESVEFLDEDGVTSLVLPRNLDQARLPGLVAGPPAPRAAAPGDRIVRRGQRLVIVSPDGQEIVAGPLDGGRVTNARLLGRDASGRFYVQTTELLRGGPEIAARSFVQRFSERRRLLDAAAVPTEVMDSVPSRVVALVPSGEVRAIVPGENALSFQVLTFRPARRDVPRPAAAPERIPIDAVVQVPGKGALADDGIRAAVPQPATTRADILRRAEDYTSINWTMKPANFSRADVENICQKETGKHWLRPHKFRTDAVGKTFGAMPYHWGGGDSPASYRDKIASGSLAGSVCTCREPEYKSCFVAFAAGVDCSGFVSRSWGISKRGTSALGGISTALDRLEDLRPGDALNKAGSHVRLFLGFRPGPELALDVLESAANVRCGGVCRSTYSVLELKGYRPLRYQGTSD